MPLKKESKQRQRKISMDVIIDKDNVNKLKLEIKIIKAKNNIKKHTILLDVN